jgi:hypothetical protein
MEHKMKSNSTALLIGSPAQLFTSLVLMITLTTTGVSALGAEVGEPSLEREASITSLAAFQSWANKSNLNSYPLPHSANLAEGLALAKKRRSAIRNLMVSDPHQVLRAAIPEHAQRHLPAEIQSELETWVSGVGDFHVVCMTPQKDHGGNNRITRFVRINGRVYRAHVYGRRSHQQTKYGIPLHGVAVGDDFVLHESSVQEVGASEVAEIRALATDVSGEAQRQTNATPGVIGRVGDKFYRFANRVELQKLEQALNAQEDELGPNLKHPISTILKSGASLEDQTGAAADSLSESPFSEGRKSVLIIRVDFSDLPEDPGGGTYTDSYVQNLSDRELTPYFQESSYGITDLTNTVTPVFRMPASAALYATNLGSWQLHLDAAAAASATYAVTNFDRVVVLFSWLGSFSDSQITYGGMAEVGGTRVWVNGEFDFRVMAHELGHTYGLWHGNLWQVSDGDPVSPSGQNQEYGDDFDTMGANFANDVRTDFNPWFKSRLNWIRDEQVLTVTSNGIYRVNRFDHVASSGRLALKVIKDSTRNYWISCRRKFTSNAAMQNGAYLVWGYNENQGSHLLDMNTPGSGVQDAALLIGNSFSDPIAGVTFQPVGEGGSTPNEYLDIQVTFGPPPDTSPAFIAHPTNQTVAIGQTALFSIAATGQPTPTLQWQRNPAGSANWQNLNDGSSYTGTRSSTLNVIGATLAKSGDRFRCKANNGVSPSATSNPATLSVRPSPGNDDFANAITLAGTAIRAVGTNTFANFQAGEPLHAGIPGGHSVWWKWQASEDSQVRANTLGSSFDTLLAIYTGDSVTQLSAITANDDSGGTWTSAVTFFAQKGITYYIAVDGHGGATGLVSLNVDIIYAPVIVSQPQDKRAFFGSDATFSALVAGALPLTYQWRFNGTNIVGATNTLLELTDLQPDQFGVYSIFACNAYGTANSSNAVLRLSTVFAWGENTEGATDVPLDMTNTVAIASGYAHTLALSANGAVTGWGMNLFGQATVPTNLTEVVAIGAGLYHSVALRADGGLVAWGYGFYDQASVPAGLTNITSISAGWWHNLALREDGTVVAWGESSRCQVPAGLTNVIAIAAAESHSVVLRNDGSVVAWGDNSYGQSSVPPGLDQVVSVAAGRCFSLALKANGKVVLWGTASEADLSITSGLTNVIAIAAGGEHGLALRRDGTVAAWGRNIGGNGGFSGQAIVPAGIANVVALAGGGYHSVVVVGSPAPVPMLFQPRKQQNNFSVILPTLHRKLYALEYRNSIVETNWSSLPSVMGGGARTELVDENMMTPQRFYRVRQN